MKKFIGLTLLILAIVSELPIIGSAAPKSVTTNLVAGKSKPQVSITFGRRRHRRYWRDGRWYYYGYERPMIGATRSRLVPVYYYDAFGIRRVRWVRQYY
jgi:hypothetical protein